MNIDTGEIVTLDELKLRPKDEQKRFVQVPEQYEQFLLNMNRAGRREWYRKNKKLFNKYGRKLA